MASSRVDGAVRFFVACVVSALCLQWTSTLVDAQGTASSRSRLAWDQRAPSLADAAAYTYSYHGDGAADGQPLTDVKCGATATAGVFECSAAFPAFTPGDEHSIQVSAAFEGERSLPSDPITFRFVVVPARPESVRIVR